MGQSHFKSNYIGFAGTEYIASVAAIKNVALIDGVTAMNVTTASANVVKVTGAGDSSYIKLGAQQYMFWGNSNTEASIIREASNLVGTPNKGSMYLSRKGQMWLYMSDTEASPMYEPANPG